MKRLSTLFVTLALGLSLVLTGCGSETANNSANTNQTEASGGSSENAPKKITEFKYYTAEQTKEAIESNAPMILLDIQVEKEFDEHHIKGVIETNAYPVKTEEEKAKLAAVLPDLKASEDPIVIVCPGGAGGAERTYQYLSEQGVDESRLYILEKGQKGWPYEDLLEK